jgi:hypothetical protein
VASEQLLAHIADETSRKKRWSRALADLEEPSRALDRELWAWAAGIPETDDAPSATKSISAAMDVISRRIDKFSISLHIGGDNTAWVDLGVQPIPQSFRVCVSGMNRPFFNAATALLLALMHAELGIAWGRGQRRSRDSRRLPGSTRSLAATEAETKLLELIEAGDEPRDGRLECELFAWFALTCESLSRADDRAIFNELEAAIVAVQRRGPRSLAVDVAIDRTAVAEIADPAGGRWLLALSHAAGRPVWRRPAVALLAAAFKAELGVYDIYKRA